ncbi:MAG TPA: ParB/RepB/Spo0J family partition protein [Longimicrobium sp.]|jgi:ParB family chromosome partitioning protein|uniref:ParB/RepB/Spo0J family partition protein n=1 Tax=Longimicrobium sp. TaxID=2029185 RepID=UPI002ED8B978
MAVSKKPRLGKGLSALLGEYTQEPAAAPGEPVTTVPTSRIAPNPFQPRREFTPEQLAELEESIRQNGLLQPLVVRPARDGTVVGAEWELVAGERRWRAVRRLGWTDVPVVVRDIDDRAMLVLAIVENVQRADLSPLEEATAYKRLMDDFDFTQAEVAESVGRERSTVANLLRLLSLPPSVHRLLDEGKLLMGHARALLGLQDEREIADLARVAADSGMTVRAVEERVRDRRPAPKPADAPEPPTRADAHVRHLEVELQRAFGTQVRIRVQGNNAGRIEIPFLNADDFDRVLEQLLGPDARR